MDHCQESGIDYDIIAGLADDNDFWLFLFYKKSTGKDKASFVIEKSKDYGKNKKLSGEVKSGSFFLCKEVITV